MRSRCVLGIGEPGLAPVVGDAAASAGLEVVWATTLTDGMGRLGGDVWTATIVSLTLPGADLGVAARIASAEGAGVVAVVTDELTASYAMEAARAGVTEVFDRAIDAGALASFFESLGSDEGVVGLPAAPASGALVGRSRALLEVFKQVGRVANSRATVLITGESGTGKELVARAIHDASDRATRPFVAVNCAAIPEDLLESELFGHERGAFTGAVARKIGRFERAQGGTLFLDEIGDMSLVLQAKILRAVQERQVERVGGEEVIEVDVRIVAATHRDLSSLVASGEFREDLLYRLAVVRLHLPPLRERADDVRELALHFAALFAREHGRRIAGISSGALERLASHAWPGNVRELANVMERAVLTVAGETITPTQIELGAGRREETPGDGLPGYRRDMTVAEVEALHMARVLAEANGHLGRAAEILGLHRNTVSRKAQEYGLGSAP